MPTIREVAKDWNCSPSYVSECKSFGCPTTSLEEARKWRLENRSKTSSSSAGDEGSGKKKLKIKRRPLTGDSITDSLAKALDAFDAISDLLFDAIERQNAPKIATIASIHNKALQAQMDAEKTVREELERRKVLVHLGEAKALATASFSAIIRRLDAMPQKLAAQVNKENSLLALDILTREARDIKEEASKAFVLK